MLGEIDIAVIEKLHVIFGSCPRHWVPKDTSPQPVDWRLGAGHVRSTPQPHEVSLTFPQLARDADREELHSLIVEMREIFMVAGTFPRGDEHSLHLQLSQLDAALEFRVRSAASLRHSTRLFAAAEQLAAEHEEQDPDYTVDDESDSEAEEEVRICAPCTHPVRWPRAQGVHRPRTFLGRAARRGNLLAEVATDTGLNSTASTARHPLMSRRAGVQCRALCRPALLPQPKRVHCGQPQQPRAFHRPSYLSSTFTWRVSLQTSSAVQRVSSPSPPPIDVTSDAGARWRARPPSAPCGVVNAG
mmetsp:Transcript_65538/g.158022  ORF Transcript_65538/g.158022 Transcript_65538/m.158022 type:complete len:301 (-) Transcript_65538:83-985(-)